MNIRDYLKEHILLFDGAMGTYFSSIYTDPLYRCEYANITSPHTVEEIHRRYLQSGAKAIKTNTFALYSEEGEEFTPAQLIGGGYQLAQRVAEEFGAYVFCDIGPVPSSLGKDPLTWYMELVDEFMALGGQYFLFETLLEGEVVNQVAQYIKEKLPESYVIASFAVDVDGFTKEGHLGSELLAQASDAIDSVGFNCICGPHHMNTHVRQHNGCGKPLSIMPNASYPTVVGQRIRYENNPHYFAKEMMENVRDGAKIIGGCCGTTPLFTQAMKELLEQGQLGGKKREQVPQREIELNIGTSAFYQKLITGKKPIAVELDSPQNDQVMKFMQGAQLLGEVGVDILTIADCPVARARMDSSLLACKVRRELDMQVMPHMTCRDRNANATKALLLGLSMEGVTDVLLVTGDPIPTAQRNEVKVVYEFHSRMLLNYVRGLNQTVFQTPFYLYAALNLGARNFDIQLEMAKKKIERGAMAFLTQPVLCDQAFENLKRAKEELSVPLVGGILPIVSHRNATFINNEIPGITVSEEIMARYVDKTKEECTQEAVNTSVSIAKKIAPYIDGYYLITPFQRVDIIAKIIQSLK